MTARVFVGTGITENYFSKAQHFGYFDTLDQMTDDRHQAFSVLLDYTDEAAEAMKGAFPHTQFIRLATAQVRVPNPNKCLQHGAFVAALVSQLGLSDDDYVVFTDSDMTIQRRFSDAELDRLLTEGRVFVATNWHVDETLAEEAGALGPIVPLFELERAFPGISRFTCFNTGVLGARVGDWTRLFTAYCKKYPLVSMWLQHYARQQWLLSWLLQTHGFKLFDHRSDFVQDIHIHGHEPKRAERLMASRVSAVDGVFCRPNGPVVFAHNLR